MVRSAGATRADSPASEFDRRVQEFDRLSQGIVLLEEVPRSELLRAVDTFAKALAEHARASPGILRSDPDGAREDPLASDHARFLLSVQELRWLCEIVAHDDHGGNRQALGQYGKILAEALREHRRREEGLLDRSQGRPPRSSRSAPGQP